MPKSPTRTQDTLSPFLLAFKPRQLLLANLVMKQSNPITLSPNQKGPLLHAVARFLKGNGFSKTLKRFLFEAQIEKNGLKESSLDLEEMYCRYTEMCNNGKTNANTQKENAPKNNAKSNSNLSKSLVQGDEQVCKEESKKPEQVKEAEKNNKATKKQKGKIVSDTPDTVKQCKLEPSSGATKESFKDASVKGKEVDDSEEKEKKSKDKKKKKKKLNDDSVEQCSVEAKQETNGAIESIVDEDIVEVKPKGKKKKKDSSDEVKVVALGDTNVTVLKKENFKTSDVDSIDNKENKGSKKRKRLESVGNDSEPANNKEDEEIKWRKVEDLKESKGREQPANNDMLLGDDEQLNEKFSEPKCSKKQRNGPAEPKIAFQRVKIEEVVFIDERLKDNSYWAKDGADIGYGAKAQEVLGQVRGRDFRHEKTKKKRGTYRGGQIDLQSHSVKFNYSDED